MITTTDVPKLTTIQMIIGSLMAGVTTFAAVALFVAGEHGLGQDAPNDELASVLLLVLGALGLCLAALYPVLHRTLIRRLGVQWRGGSSPAGEDPGLLTGYQTLTIVQGAMAEGFALFATVIYLLTGVWLALGGTAIGLFVLARIFPTDRSFRAFAATVTSSSIS